MLPFWFQQLGRASTVAPTLCRIPLPIALLDCKSRAAASAQTALGKHTATQQPGLLSYPTGSAVFVRHSAQV